MNNTFCIFIISHGRPNKISTIKTLKKCGYSGPLFIVCDNEDKTIAQYQEIYGSESVLLFDKLHYARLVDSCDNFQNRRTTTHARNACFDLAKERRFDYFLVLDDDYSDFRFTFNRGGQFVRTKIKCFDRVCSAMIAFLNTNERIDSICMMQTGDMIGGENSSLWKNYYFPFKNRKAMNSFFCKTSRRFWFFSRLNEDVNTYLILGSRGRLFFTIPDVYLQQAATQANAGGMSEAYLASGTYVKSFYTVMNCPSFAVVTVTAAMRRFHHKISWNNAVPKIISDVYKKSA